MFLQYCILTTINNIKSGLKWTQGWDLQEVFWFKVLQRDPSSFYYVIGGSWKNKDYQPIKQMFLVSIFSPGRAASTNHWECLSLIRPLQTPTQAFSEILKTWSRLKIAVIFQFTISRSVGDTQGYLFEYYLSYFFPFLYNGIKNICMNVVWIL